MDENQNFGFSGFESSRPVGSPSEIKGETEPNTDSALRPDEPISPPTPEPEVYSFTPTAQVGLMPDYGASDTREEPLPPASTPVPPVPSTVPPVYSAPKKEKKRREKRPLSLGTVIAATLISALLASGVTSVVFLYADLVGGGDPSSPAPVTQIQVNGTADTLVEAIAQKVTPSVVGVRVTSSVNVGFFGGTQSQVGEGSGIIYTQDGYIITNYHVISKAVESDGTVEVFFSADTEEGIAATVVGYDVSADLAVLKVEKTGLPAIEIGNSVDLKVGQTAVAIGNPGGLQFMGSTSAGVISGLNRTIQLESSGSLKLIQTDAAINPGNSGGALVDAQGKLIGINSAKLAATGYEGMGFAIPVNSAIEICDRIIQRIGEPNSYLGVEISTYYDSTTLQRMGYPAGVVIYRVTEGSPAYDAGLQRGDIVTQFNGVPVTSYVLFNSEKNKYSPGETVTLTVYRQGKTADVSIQLGASN